jgi:hypothetical protein
MRRFGDFVLGFASSGGEEKMAGLPELVIGDAKVPFLLCSQRVRLDPPLRDGPSVVILAAP